MELRYLGFEQKQNKRAYKFDAIEKGEPAAHFVVTADLALFLENRIGIQEGPSLCALKLSGSSDLPASGAVELTREDMQAHAAARTLADAKRAESRRHAPRRHAPAESPVH